MCVAHYLHFHHVPPCRRPVRYLCLWTYCARAAYDPISRQAAAACPDVTESSPKGSGSGDPCSLDLCQVEERCRDGGCRLDEVGGRWVCCACRGAVDRSTGCLNPRPDDPGTFCCHRICEYCTADGRG
ncbi:hypothetical protein ACJ41O_003279 [Fusarium nematophilum]